MGFNVSNLLFPETIDGKQMMFTNFSKFGASDAGGGVIVLGTSGLRVRVHALFFAAASATKITLWRNTTTVFGPIDVPASGAFVLPS